MGLGGFFMLRSLRAAGHAQRLRDSGEARQAIIADIPRRKGRKPARMLVWREADGQEGRTGWLLDPRLSGYAPGQEITVYRIGSDAVWQGTVGPPGRA